MIEISDLRAAQALVLRAPHGPTVAQLVLTVPSGVSASACAFHALTDVLPSFGPQPPSAPFCSIGFSFCGLERLGLPEGYQRIFRRLAPAFAAGAALRAEHRGDCFANTPDLPWADLEHQRAHILVTLHGPTGPTEARATELAARWLAAFHDPKAAGPSGTVVPAGPPALCGMHTGRRLGAPPGRDGEWVHFGFRDGLSEVCIDDVQPRQEAPDCRHHAAGALLHGHVNDEGFNVFALSQAPDKVRAFFRNGSFGVLRPMHQDLNAFEHAVERWARELSRAAGKPITDTFVKAKLSGRWPGGFPMRPGAVDEPVQGPLKLDLIGDDEGMGCPFGSHVRRMRAAPDRNGRVFARPLQRRGVPYGTPAWSGRPEDAQARGLIGQFFCAGIEDQFEHLLGQWAARPPLGFAADDAAPDPFIGPHADPGLALNLPLLAQRPQQLTGFGPWTTPLGTMYAWYPGCHALQAMRQRDYERDDLDGPWL